MVVKERRTSNWGLRIAFLDGLDYSNRGEWNLIPKPGVTDMKAHVIIMSSNQTQILQMLIRKRKKRFEEH